MADKILHIAARIRDALALHRAGRLAEARALYEAILAEAPRHPPALNGLGVVLHAAGEFQRAGELLHAAVRERPGSAIYRNNLGNTLRALGQADKALAAYREALRLKPAYALAAYNQGALHLERDELDAARRCFDAALALDPKLAAAAGAYNDLGARYQLLSRNDDALACFVRALELNPGLGEAHFNRARLLADLARFEQAAASFEEAIALAPRLATESGCHLAVVRRHLCDWQDEAARTAGLIGQIEETLRAHPNRGLPPLTLNVVAVPAALRLDVARHLARGLERATQETRARCAFRHARRDPRRLRIGYVSPDFRTHAVGSLAHDLFRHHDRNAVTVHAYSLISVDDAYQRSVRAGVDAFADVSRDSPEAIARRIHADGIDVLVDMAGYTTYSKTSLFALRPAPVQLHWLGYLDTMGADFLPYILADAWTIPAEAAAGFSETVVSLPRGFALASPAPAGGQPAAEPPSRAQLGLPGDAFVFCCMNGLHKLDAETFDAWMRVLARVPGSVLWLADEGAGTAHRNLAREAAARGVDPARLCFAPRVPLAEYLARYRRADLFLDTFAYNAGATAVGALGAGLPVLTRPGANFMSRMGASLCAAAGIPEMICADTRAYEERAVALAGNPAELAALRRRLEGAGAPLFDARGFARQLESAYRALWHHHQEGAAARRIEVELG